jgi:hypothetical protein
VAHACKPSYSGGRGQEDHGSKPAEENSLRHPISKNPSQKKAGGMAQVVVSLPSECETLSSNPKEDMQMTSRYMKKFSTLLVIGEQIKISNAISPHICYMMVIMKKKTR